MAASVLILAGLVASSSAAYAAVSPVGLNPTIEVVGLTPRSPLRMVLPVLLMPVAPGAARGPIRCSRLMRSWALSSATPAGGHWSGVRNVEQLGVQGHVGKGRDDHVCDVCVFGHTVSDRCRHPSAGGAKGPFRAPNVPTTRGLWTPEASEPTVAAWNKGDDLGELYHVVAAHRADPPWALSIWYSRPVIRASIVGLSRIGSGMDAMWCERDDRDR